MDTDDVSEDVDEPSDDKEKKEEKIEQNDQRSVNQKTYHDFAEKYHESFLKQFPKDKRDELGWKEKNFVNRVDRELEESLTDMNHLGKNNKMIDKLMPVMPMGKNTQPENKSGFRADKGTKTTITPASKKLVESNPLVKIQHDGLREAWNALPDEQRDLIGEFQIRAIDNEAGQYTGGTYNHSKKKLTVTLHPRANMQNVFNNLHHEIGHAQYHKLMETSPDKIKKFNEAVSLATVWGNNVTAYAGSYRGAKLKAKQYMKSAIADLDLHIENSKKHPERFQPVPDGYREKSVKTLTRRIENAETIYENETHSALAQLVTGTNTHDINIVKHTKKQPAITNHRGIRKEALEELFNAYKELHE